LKKLGLVLGAGGAKGVAHVGVLQALEDSGIKPSVVTGCSAGSVVAACYAIGMKPKEIYAECAKLTMNDFADPSINVMKNRSVFKSQKIQTLLEKHLKDSLIEDLPMPFACTAADLNTGKLHEFISGRLTTAVRASCAIPVIFSPVEQDGMLLVDGGLLERTPVRSAIKLGAEVTVAVDVNCEANFSEPVKGIVSLALRSIDVMEHRAKPAGKRADITVRPCLTEINQFRVEKVDYIYKQGYKSIIDEIDKIKELLAG